MMLLKKAVYDKLVEKVNDIDTSGFVLKTKYETDKWYYNLGHNILGLFNVLPNFSFTTSETNRDY